MTVLFYFLSICVPFLIAGGLVFYNLYTNAFEKRLNSYRVEELRHLKDLKRSIIIDFDAVSANVKILSQNPNIEGYQKRDGEIFRKKIASLFLSYSRNIRLYDQIRYIDDTGMEVVRVNYNNGSSSIVPDNKLQNKASRYYFKDTLALHQGEIFISPLDLNREHNKIELPRKPILHFGIPVVDRQGHKNGILLINYLASGMLDSLTKANIPGRYNMLLNTEGYWLRGRTTEEEFGFMYPDKQNITFGGKFPDEWNTISTTDSGQLYTPKGLFTYMTLYPFAEVETLTVPPFSAHNKFIQSTKQYQWKQVLQIPADSFTEVRQKLKSIFFFWYCNFAGVLLLFALSLSFLLTNRKISFEQNAGQARALAESEQRYREIVEDTNSIILKFNPDLQIQFLNEYGLQFFEYKEQEILGHSMLDTIVPSEFSDGISSREMLAKIILDTERYSTNENENIKSNGERVWVAWKNKVSLNPDGTCKEVLSVGYDITERVKKDTKLLTLSMAVQQSDSMIMITDQQGIIEYVNPAFTRNTGWLEDEAVGQSPHILNSGHHPRSFFSNLWHTLSLCENWHGEIRNRKKDGELYWEYCKISPIINLSGKIVNFVAIKEDISSRKHLQQELRISKRRYQAFIEETNDLITRVDAAGAFLFVNRMSKKFFGLTPTESIGKSAFDFIHPEDRDDTYNWFKNIIASKGSHGSIENRQVSISGDVHHMLWECSFYYDQSGNFIAVNNISRDITRRKQMENELLISREQAEKANRAKSTFLANMGHEIRTPMNAILGMTHLCLQTELESRQLDYLTKIDTAATGLLGLLNDLLDFSKIEAGKLSIETIPFNLKDILVNTTNLMQNKIEEKGLLFSVDLSQDVPCMLIGDPLHLGQILINLCNNAVKFTNEGKIIIYTQRAPQQQEKQLNNQITLQFTVQDSGIGMSKSQMARLFQPFSQADSSTTRKYGGTGLGLSIVKRLVELMNGTVRVESQPDRGSAFIFTGTFILQKKEVQADTVNKKFDNNSLKSIAGAKILLVEDNLFNQQIARELLEYNGFIVDIAENGKVAVDMIQKKTYQLVLMDIQMPIMDGYKAVTEIRKDPAFDTLPILAMTADAMVEAKEKAQQAGMNAHVAKPINLQQLFSALLQWIPSGNYTPSPVESSRKTGKSTYLSFDFAHINVEEGLAHVGGNHSLYQSLLRKFYQTYRGQLQRIKQVFADNDTETAAVFLHTIKGVAGNIGAHGIYTAVMAVEKLHAEGSLPELSKAKTHFIAELKKVLDELKDLKKLQQLDILELEKEPGNEAYLLEQLDLLKGCLQKREPKTSKKIIQDIASYSWSEPYTELTQQLLELIRKYKF